MIAKNYRLLNKAIEEGQASTSEIRQALLEIMQQSSQWGEAGLLLQSSLERYFSTPDGPGSLDSAFGLIKPVGRPKNDFNQKHADIAVSWLEQRLAGKLAKEIEFPGIGQNNLKKINKKYRFYALTTAELKRKGKGWTTFEHRVIERITRISRTKVKELFTEEDKHRERVN